MPCRVQELQRRASQREVPQESRDETESRDDVQVRDESQAQGDRQSLPLRHPPIVPVRQDVRTNQMLPIQRRALTSAGYRQ